MAEYFDELEYFWATGRTIPPDMGFQRFGAGHLAWLFLLVLLCLLLGIRYRKWGEEKRRLCRRILAALLVADELFKDISTLATGNFQLDFLPLHLCSINIFLILADAVKPSDTLRELLYAVCLPGALFALVFPGWAYLPLCNALCIHSFTAHILLFLYPFLLICSGFQPELRRFGKVLPFCLPVAAGAYCFNQAFGTNFMFLNYAGTGNPLSWFETRLGTPGYLIGIPILCVLCWAVLYGVPFLRRRRKAGRSQRKTL